MQNGHAKGNEQSYCAFAGDCGTAAIAAATKTKSTRRRMLDMGDHPSVTLLLKRNVPNGSEIARLILILTK
jgi:hypothetical protein